MSLVSSSSSLCSSTSLFHNNLCIRNRHGSFVIGNKRRLFLPITATSFQRRRRRDFTVNHVIWRASSQNAVMSEKPEATAAVPTSVPVRVALELLQAGHRYLDVRTPEEFSEGHAPGAINIPYMFKVGSGMTKNPHFESEVSSQFSKDDEIIVGCLSGKRSLMAAADLLASGYSCIRDIAGGYDAWSRNRLPVEL